MTRTRAAGAAQIVAAVVIVALLVCGQVGLFSTSLAGAAPTTPITPPHARAVPAPPKPGVQVSAVSCPSVQFCAVTTDSSRAYVFADGSWSRPVRLHPEYRGGSTAVSCASASFCIAADWRGRTSRWNGASWIEGRRIFTDGQPYPHALTCVSARFCVAGDLAGKVAFWHGRTWTRPRQVLPPGEPVTLDCPTSRYCLAVGAINGTTAVYTHGRWARRANAPAWHGGDFYDALGCASRSICFAATSDGRIITFHAGRWGTPQRQFTSGGAIAFLSCTGRQFCLFVDGNHYSRYNGHRWARRPDVRRAGFIGLGCATRAFCLAGTSGASPLSRYDGRTWRAVG